jgi:hypothetical protein
MSMYPKDMFFTSESVSEGHVDKVCDQISDAVLDECLKHDPLARVACNTYITMLLVGGEITTTVLFDVSQVVRDLGTEIGCTSPKFGFDFNTAAAGCEMIVLQSLCGKFFRSLPTVSLTTCCAYLRARLLNRTCTRIALLSRGRQSQGARPREPFVGRGVSLVKSVTSATTVVQTFKEEFATAYGRMASLVDE